MRKQPQVIEASREHIYKNMIGKIFTDLDLKNLDHASFLSLRNAIPKHGVVCVKEQKLSRGEMVSLTKKFGDPVLLPEGLRFNNTQSDFPELTRVSNVLPDGSIIENHSAAEYWHVDGDFWPSGKNYIFNLLYAVTVPPKGGQTGFADLRSSYQSLAPDTKRRIQELQFISSCRDIPDFKNAKAEELLPDAYHNLSYLHPETGLISLYVNYFGTRITSLSDRKSRELLKELEMAVEKPEHHYIHNWEPNDILIWDNTSVMHRSMGGYGAHKRLLYRTQAFVNQKLKVC